MQTITLNLHFQTLPPIVTRNRHALILVRTGDGKFVLGCKKHYPEHISRLVGGGIEGDEDPWLGASRELNEELLIEVDKTELKPLAKVVAKITQDGQDIEFTTWLYFYQLKLEKISPNDDLDELKYLSEGEYLELIERFKQLPTDLHPILGFAWSDYGQLYSQIHQIALDKYHQLNTSSV